jgi:hypothetical protein
MKVLGRIISSQKAVMSATGAVAVVAGAEAGLSESILQIVGALFAMLVGVQGALDFKHGSASDGTGRFTNTPG